MGFVLESVAIEILCSVLLCLWLLYWYLTRHYDYWEDRGVAFKKPKFPFGSIKDIVLLRTFAGKGHDDIYKEFPNERFYGILEIRRPSLVVKDPELIKLIMVKDFNHFVDRPVIFNNSKEYIMQHLLNLVGQEWKDTRAKLTPTFTSGKLKLMFSLMDKCCEQLKAYLDKEIQEGKTVDAKEMLSRFTMDIIASCAFGLDCNALAEENDQFYRMFGGVTNSSKFRYIRRIFLVFFPAVLTLFGIKIVRPELTSFVTSIVHDSIEYRKKNNIKRNDFIDLLINIQRDKSSWTENGHSNTESKNTSFEGLTVEQMTAHTFVFFIAGFETASSLMAFCLYELSRHQHIQEKLYQELREALDRNEGKISYQMMMEVPYLEQVINETLRLYGSAQVLSRVCTQPYQIPDSDLVLEKGLKVVIPLYPLHHDPQYYPDPEEFKPERFTPEESRKRHPFVFMPFGEGPRNCIGMRFGLMQAKVGLTTVIMNFQVDLSPDQDVPIEINKRSIVLMPAKPVLLKFSKRSTI